MRNSGRRYVSVEEVRFSPSERRLFNNIAMKNWDFHKQKPQIREKLHKIRFGSDFGMQRMT